MSICYHLVCASDLSPMTRGITCTSSCIWVYSVFNRNVVSYRRLTRLTHIINKVTQSHRNSKCCWIEITALSCTMDILFYYKLNESSNPKSVHHVDSFSLPLSGWEKPTSVQILLSQCNQYKNVFF